MQMNLETHDFPGHPTVEPLLVKKNGALDLRRNLTQDLTRMPSAARLEMAPKVMVKQDIPKPDELMGKVVLFSQRLGYSEELIFMFWWRIGGTEELDNEVMSIDGVLIFSVIYKELQTK